MPGRKKSALAKYFKPISTDSKVPKVKCRFCCESLAKNGTRMGKHLKKCKNVPETVTLILESPNKENQEDDAVTEEMDINQQKNRTWAKEIYINLH